MTTLQTIGRVTGGSCYTGEHATLRDAVEAACRAGVSLVGASLRGAELYSANLYGADLREADLRDAHLYGAYMRRADLRDAHLDGADLRKADLRDADLRKADLRDAQLYGATLRGAELREARCDHPHEAEFRRLVAAHDVTHMYSDDPRVWRRGQQELDEIRAYAAAHLTPARARALWNEVMAATCPSQIKAEWP